MTTVTLQDGLTLREAEHVARTARLVAGPESPYRNIRHEYSYTRGYIVGDAPQKRYRVVAETAGLITGTYEQALASLVGELPLKVCPPDCECGE